MKTIIIVLLSICIFLIGCNKPSPEEAETVARINRLHQVQNFTRIGR